MGRLQSIQILRFVAAAMVVILHSNNALGIGAAGVDIFFVISGFIIATIGSGQRPGHFLLDRARRVYPIYWIVTVPVAAFYIGALGLAPDKLATSLSLWPVWSDYTFPYVNVGWTLCFEMLFYLAFAAVLWRRAALPALLIGYAALMALAFDGVLIARFLGNPIIMEFLLGALVARLPSIAPRYGAWILGIGSALLAASIPWAHWLMWAENIPTLASWPRFIIWGVPAALVVYGGRQMEPWAIGRRVAIPVYLGDASYSIYLVHWFVAAPLALVAWWPIAALAAVAAGVGVHRYIEAPVLKLMKQQRQTRKDRPHERVIERAPDAA